MSVKYEWGRMNRMNTSQEGQEGQEGQKELINRKMGARTDVKCRRRGWILGGIWVRRRLVTTGIMVVERRRGKWK